MEMRHHHPPLSLTQSRTWLSESRRRLARGFACRVRRFSLDRALSRGEDPSADPILAQRAEQLRSPGMRRGLAADLRDLVERAGQPVGLSAIAPVAPAVKSSRGRILGIAERLEGDRAIGIRGVAMVHLMLCDSTSPFWSGTTEALEGALDDVMIGLGS
jgi:hypothetical protein